MRVWLIGLALAGGALLGAGCDNQQTTDEVSLLTEENQALRQELEDRNRALESADSDRRRQSQRIGDLERQVGAMQAQPAQPVAPATGFEEIDDVSVSRVAGGVKADVEGDVLFDSGKATLKPSARRILDQIASVLNGRYSNNEVIVEGHTDSDPIRRSGFKSNYHLGFERAFAVREYLIKKGVAANRIALMSFGPNMPEGTKAQSRRVGVVVLTG